MSYFVLNAFLAVVWAASHGELSVANLSVGFALGYGLLWLGSGVLGSGQYAAKAPRFVEFLLFFLWEMLVANLKVAYDVLTPASQLRPAIIALPLDATTDLEITLVANFISLTPGTLSLDVSQDREVLYIHAMYRHDAEREKRRLKKGFERRLLALLR